MTTNKKHIEWLERYNACAAGLRFASQYETLREAWDACTNVEHLAWVAETGVEHALGVSIDGMTTDEYDQYVAPIERARDDACDQYLGDAQARCDAFRAEVDCPEVDL